jgi:hypothetical protein
MKIRHFVRHEKSLKKSVVTIKIYTKYNKQYKNVNHEFLF